MVDPAYDPVGGAGLGEGEVGAELPGGAVGIEEDLEAVQAGLKFERQVPALRGEVLGRLPLRQGQAPLNPQEFPQQSPRQDDQEGQMHHVGA